MSPPPATIKTASPALPNGNPMKSKILQAIAIVSMCITAYAQPASATSISFQGALNGPGGQPLPNGSYNITFRFYDGPGPTGNAVSTNIVVPNVTVTSGVASTFISVDPAWFDGATRYLGVTIGNGSELAPRILTTAVPYALSANALSAPVMKLNGEALVFHPKEVPDTTGTWRIEPHAFFAPDLPGTFAIVRYNPAADPVKCIAISPSGFVGIGTPNPGTKLWINDIAPGITLHNITDPDSGGGVDPSWRIESDAFGNGNFGIVRYVGPAQETRSLILTRSGNVGIGTALPGARLDVRGTTRTEVLQITSDRNSKRAIERVDSRLVLDKLAALPLSTWAYTNNPTVRHIGPMAQDFQAAFGYGDSDKHIATIDADGVALAAIQGLHRLLKENDSRVAELESATRAKDAVITELEARVKALEKLVQSRFVANAVTPK
jgi:hypothetical protein